MKKWLESIEFTKTFSKINTYETEGKKECILLVENIIKTRTNAVVNVYDIDTDAPYIIAKITKTSPKYKLLLEGHLDVVSPNKMKKPFDIEDKDGVLYGRGVADMKGGCGAILSVFLATADDINMKGDLYLMFSTDEEYAGENIKKALDLEHLPKVDFALIPEPSSGKICNAHKGEVWLQMEFFGKNAHSSTPKLGENAIYMASDFIHKIKKLEKRYEENINPEYGSETISVGVIEGGNNPNIIPDYCKILIDQRYLPEQGVENITTDIENIISECKDENENFNCKLTVLGNWNSMYTDENANDFKRIRKAFSKSYNKELDLSFWNAWGEGGYINKYNIPTVYFGPGEIKFAHSDDEQIKMNEILEVSEAYYDVIKELCF